jgi:hypothetical protein
LQHALFLFFKHEFCAYFFNKFLTFAPTKIGILIK